MIIKSHTNICLLAAALTLYILLLSAFHAAAQPDRFREPHWQQLDRELNGKDVIGLGEEGHGFESINEAKGLMLDFLRSRIGIKSVVFENSFCLSVISFLKGDAFERRLKSSFYPFWNTESVRAALDPFYKMEKMDSFLIAGCDIQEDCRYTTLSQYLIEEGLVKESIQELLSADSILAYYIGQNFSRKNAITAEEYRMLKQFYEAITAEAGENLLPLFKQKLLGRTLQNRIWLCQYLSLRGIKDRMHFRDSLMAENVLWLKRELYPEEKIAIWAAISHISKNTGNGRAKWMGNWISQKHQKTYYSIAFKKNFTVRSVSKEDAAFEFDSISNGYDLSVLLKKKVKIAPAQWMTPCKD